MRKLFAYAKTKTQISFVVTAKMICVFVFATQIVQSFLLPTPEIFQASSHSSVAVQPVLCRTWLETPKTGFLTTRLIRFLLNVNVVFPMLLKST